MPIIDAHIHLWSHDMARYPDIAWREAGNSRLPAVDGSAGRLVAAMDAAGVAYALNVQVPWYREDNRYHLDSVATYPGRFAFLAVMDLDRPGVAERFEQAHGTLGAQGFRVHYQEIEPFAAGKFDDLLTVARRLDVPLQFLGQTAQIPALTQVLARCEGLKVVIDHLLHPNPVASPEYAAWDGFFALAQLPTVYVKVSLQVNCSKAPYPHRDLHDFTKRVLDAFTPQRCMWGSNYPLIPEGVSYQQVLDIVRTELPFLAGEELAAVLGGTAATLWQPRT
ncbi:MAG: amidohydrolase [Fimbriimonadaceae bacterium]|nr:amidohydrolase [Fimbriimonadaceae bacterium]